MALFYAAAFHYSGGGHGIRASKAEPKLQREVIFHAYRMMEAIGDEIYSFVKIDDENSTKKLLKRFIDKANVSTTTICTHDYKYLPELKQMAGSMILFAPLSAGHDFANYNTFLHKLNMDEFIVFGTYTHNIPFIVQLDDGEGDFEPEVEDVPMFERPTPVIEEQAPVVDEYVPELPQFEAEPEIEPEIELYAELEPEIEPDIELEPEATPDIEVELPQVFQDDDIFAADLDVVEQTLGEPDLAEPEFEEQIVYPDDEDIIIEDESLVEEMDNVPIYPADDIERRGVPSFEKGDSVSHAKYGQGVVEKMIKYGNKTLVSIDFQDAGRRLLDPAISQINKTL